MQIGNISSTSGHLSFLRKHREFLGNVALAIGSLLAVLVFAEAAASLFLPPPIAWRDPQELYNHDPLLGHALTPGQHTFTHSFPVETNSHGFRDHEFSVHASLGTFRILCLGDSLTFGDGVAVEDTYPKQLEKILREGGWANLEVLNAGVPSYDTWQEVTLFKTKGIRFEPDVVVLGFYGNDIVPRPETIKTALSGGGTLRRRGFGGVLPDGMVHLLKSSRFLLFLKDRVGRLADAVRPTPEAIHQRALLEGLQDEFVEQGWREVGSSLKEMTELREAHGFRFVLVIFPMAEQLVHQHPNAQYPKRLKRIAEELHITVIDLRPAFEREFKGFGSLFIEWDGHPNPRAHRIAAEELSRVLAPLTGTAQAAP